MVIPSDNDMLAAIGEMMDRAKLTPGNVQGTKAPIAVIISGIRVALAREFMDYVKQMEHGPTRIEVQEAPEEPM